MKKFGEVFVDIMLFSFLLLIFIIPVLVSFNLDPIVYNADGNEEVAGVNNNFEAVSSLIDSSSLSYDSERFEVISEKNSENAAGFEIKIFRGSPLEEEIVLGTIESTSQANAKFKLSHFTNNNDISVFLIYDDKKVKLDTEEINIAQAQGSEHKFGVEFFSTEPINFERNIKLEIELIAF